jgi:hypothetical protein
LTRTAAAGEHGGERDREQLPGSEHVEIGQRVTEDGAGEDGQEQKRETEQQREAHQVEVDQALAHLVQPDDQERREAHDQEGVLAPGEQAGEFREGCRPAVERPGQIRGRDVLGQIEARDHERQPYEQGTDRRRRRAGERSREADGVDDGKEDVERQLGPGVERAASGADVPEEVGDLRGRITLPEAIRRLRAAQELPA